MEKKPPGTSASDLAARERMLENRTVWVNAHDSAVAQRDSAISQREETVAKRDAAISDREELVRLREAQLEARREADAARVEREHLLVRIRDVNEQLVLATLRAQQLAEEANVARAAADDTAERFRSLIVTLSALVWRATAAGQIEVDHEAWRKFTGEHPEEGAWGWLDAVHPADRDRVREVWTQAVVAAKPYACQHRLRSRRKGGYAWVEARAVPIVKAGTVREWIGMMADVSDRVRVEEARDQFIGILGHDLRNPLASIVAGVELLGALPEPYARTVSRVARSAHRIDAIIHDLLDFARARLGGGIPVSSRRCDMRVICDDVVEEIRHAHLSRDIRFESSGDLRGQWDPDRLEQVISNLVGNAVMHGKDPITLTSRAEADHVVTSVHNRGPTIPDAVIPTLFEPFTSVADTNTRNVHQGLGLGLYIANEIVNAHGGTLAVSSAADETTFTFTLPRDVPPRPRTTTSEVPPKLLLG